MIGARRTIAVGALLLTASGSLSALGPAPVAAQTRPSEQDIFGAPEQKPAEQKPAEQKPAEQKPAEQKPAEQKPAGQEAGDKPGDKPPEKPSEQPGDLRPPAEGVQTAPLPEGQTPAEAAPQQGPGRAPLKDREEMPPADTPESIRDASILGPEGDTKVSEDAAPDDPLRIGGMFYLRTQTAGRQGDPPEDWVLSSPSLVDVFLDARPNDRVRAFVLGRMLFDPTAPPAGGVVPVELGVPDPSGAMGTPELSSLFATRDRGPHVALDQMWLRFDLDHTVFVTAGKQHVRWGTGRFWSPTDYLHIRRRNPLDVFDARTGTTMLKLHFPWESRGWNFYAYGVLEDAVAIPTLGQIFGAARAEIVLGTTEIGLGALVQREQKPKLGADISTGIWDLDLYGEIALRYGSEIDRVVAVPDTGGPDMESLPAVIDRLYPVDRDFGLKPQVVGGLSYSRKYNDNDVWNIGIEYFYNSLGYDSPEVYPGLVLPRAIALAEPATFFYLGRQYGALFINVPAPYSWDYTTFTLSNLGNFSDGSYISRLDYSLLLLTHLRFEAFVAVHYGTREGEFRFGVKDLRVGGTIFSLPPGLIDLGLALRVSI